MIPKLIVIIGPTASGKSDLAVNISKYLYKTRLIESEVISMDSRQIYTGLDLGTGKITKDEMQGVKHHMLDITDPSNIGLYSVKDYKEDAAKIISKLHSEKKIPILCGGTGLYLDAILYNHVGDDTEPDPELRASLESKSLEELTTQLQSLADSNKTKIVTVDIKNKRRVIRAIEIILKKGYIPKINNHERQSNYDEIIFYIDVRKKKIWVLDDL